MPPRYLRKGTTKLKKCAEFPIEVCDTVKADGCCGVLPCKLCLELVDYNGSSYGSADFGSASWAGTVGGIAFVAYWEVGYESGECEFVVIFNDEEVYRASCYEGASCRNPSGSVDVTVNYEDGVLSWSVHEPRELALIDDPDTGCRTHFCGACHCSCDCLCVTVTDPYGNTSIGEICDSSYPCDAPVWEGTVGDIDLSIALGRDEYGECIITATVDGYDEQEPVAAPGCGSMTAMIELYDGTIIEVRCKECNCEVSSGPCECDGRCVPLVADTDTSTDIPNPDCVNRLPVTLGVEVSATSSSGDACFNGSGTITYKTPLTGGTNCWEGDITGSCTDCDSNARTWTLRVVMCCPDSVLGTSVTLTPGNPAIILPVEDAAMTAIPTACDPFLLEGCIPGDITAFVVACIADMPPTATVYTNVCVLIYEIP